MVTDRSVRYARWCRLWVFLLIAAVWPAETARAQGLQVGTVEYAKGAVTAASEAGEVRIVGKGAALFEKEVLSTGADSFAVIGLTDGSRISVRPDTVFTLEAYAYGKAKASAVMRLFKGGLRALTGLIAKHNPKDGFRLKTATAVVGVRGTEFDARLCEADCGAEAAKLQRAGEAPGSPVAARVVRLEGRLWAIGAAGDRRDLQEGGPVYERDVLETGREGFAVVVFRDNSRVTLQSSTRFKVDGYRFSEESGGSAFFRLLKGGIRALTGAIARRNRQAFTLGTPTAVVGVRGTAFDLRLCETDDCTDRPRQQAPAAGRVVRLEGAVTARSGNDAPRRLDPGSAVFEGDLLETEKGAFAVVVFRDNSRVTLQSGTRFQVEQYRYSADDGAGRAFFRLFRGGLRVLSGWMAKRNARTFNIGTPTAVVGVRGTLLDILSTVGVAEADLLALGVEPARLSEVGGIIVYVRQGGAVLTSDAGSFQYGVGQAVLMPGPAASPVAFDAVPPAIQTNPAPAPETESVDMQTLFSRQDAGETGKLVVSVRDGAVALTPEGGREVVVETGRAAVLTGWEAAPALLNTPPAVMQNLPAPAPETVPASTGELFGTQAQKTADPGLYVRVVSGHVVMENDAGTLHLGAGEAGFADPFQNTLVRLAEQPLFQVQDPVPDPRHLEQYLEKIEGRIDQDLGIPAGQGQEDCECEIVY